jgi:phosphatidylserine/phosphatidylglycerophosphate/cardiolipin synthase-like enzyme
LEPAEVDDAELVGGVLIDSVDLWTAARQLAAILTEPNNGVRPPSRSSFDPDLVGVLRARFEDDRTRIEAACNLGAAWVLGRRSVDSEPPWELVASLPVGVTLPFGLRRTTGETLMQLVTQATRSLRLAAPFIDRPGMAFLADALAASTARGVVLEIMLPTRSTHAGDALGDLEQTITRDGVIQRFSVAALRPDAPWAHLKVLVSDSAAAYIGSANVTDAGIAGPNLELGVLVRGRAVEVVDQLLDLFRDH